MMLKRPTIMLFSNLAMRSSSSFSSSSSLVFRRAGAGRTSIDNAFGTQSSRLFLSTSTTVPPTNAGPWLDENSKMYKLWSHNEYTTSKGIASPKLPVYNPATGHITAYVPETTTDEFNTMLEQAHVAFNEWKNVSVQQRQRVMFQYQQLIRNYEDDLVRLIVSENGKTVADAKGDIFRGLEVVESACQVAPLLLGDSIRGLSATVDTVSYREPLGVCAGICPFNFPAMIPLWMFPLAVTCGNTFVLKPSEKTPGTAMLLAELAAQAGLPPNVLQVVHGSQPVVDQICTHPHIQAISFVGSNKAGESIFHKGTSNGKRVQANLGAKNHAIVLLDDADRTATISAIVGAAFGAAGQRCMALSTIVLVGDKNMADEWLEEIVAEAKELNVGPGWDATTDVGPLIRSESKERIHTILNTAMQQGTCTIHLDGRTFTKNNDDNDSICANGHFLGPTVVSVTSTDNAAYTNELFGPVLTCLTANSLDDALDIVNANPYGNGAAIFTQSGAAARKFTHEVQAGQVGINVPIPVPLPMFSFTGNKASIRGDLNFYGKSGVQFYTQYKTVTSNWLYTSSSNEKNVYGGVTMPTMGSK